MIITIHQPEHLPWLGFFNKLSKAEVFVILDSVPYRKNYFQNRNKIIGSNGEQYIGIPTVNVGHIEGTIASTKIAVDGNHKWKTKYLNTIKMSYGKYPFFEEVYSMVEKAISIETEFLEDINVAIIKSFADCLGFHPEYIRSSDLNAKGAKSDLILDICKVLNASTYIAGPSGRDYLNMQSFMDANIKIVFNDYIHPQYPQKRVKEFVPYLSSLDLFMNCGFDEGCRIIIEGNEGTSSI